jgi:hypothetical protein
MDGMMLALLAAARRGEGALIDHIDSIDAKRLKLVVAMLTLRVIALTEPARFPESSSARAVVGPGSGSVYPATRLSCAPHS